MIILKARSVDEGYCRVYFGSKNHLYCLQRGRGEVLELMECTEEGEPLCAMDEKLLPHFYFASKPFQPTEKSKLVEDVNDWIKSHHSRNSVSISIGLRTDIYKANQVRKDKMDLLHEEGYTYPEACGECREENGAVDGAIERLYEFEKEFKI